MSLACQASALLLLWPKRDSPFPVVRGAGLAGQRVPRGLGSPASPCPAARPPPGSAVLPRS